ncbi:hypothetical protein QWJ34_22240 [Saccharibacillus sp. CPCC 101409]|uniref:hypothetical protein n=1 Tax=Saccharibacillus sp. CPCC 101409 TaxID=3058041 RepID=UPI00267410A7|nr:hypothetical protein [Saccharibacillus sp. CPCC 101409]MDO3412501.1 hypothetical protein [Saccharibacillus sp. CPCC 101409]
MNRTKLCVSSLLLAGLITACGENSALATASASSAAPPQAASASARPKAVAEARLIPAGWHALLQPNGGLARTEGDLNKDGIPDLALVIEQDGEDGEPLPRSLLLAFGDGKGAYRLSEIAERVVLSADEGGVWGDPFRSVAIERGAVVIRHYGGSADRWYNTFRFRYQNEDWVLIGITRGVYFTGNELPEEADEDDFNLLTGDYTSKRTDSEGQVREKKGNQGKKPLISIEDFDIQQQLEQKLLK